MSAVPAILIAAETDGATVAQRTLVVRHSFSAWPIAGDEPPRCGTRVTSDIFSELARARMPAMRLRAVFDRPSRCTSSTSALTPSARNVFRAAGPGVAGSLGAIPQSGVVVRGVVPAALTAGAKHARSASTTIALVKWPVPLPKVLDITRVGGGTPGVGAAAPSTAALVIGRRRWSGRPPFEGSQTPGATKRGAEPDRRQPRRRSRRTRAPETRRRDHSPSARAPPQPAAP